MSPLIVFQQMVVILTLVMGGYICKKIGKISDESKKCLSFLVVNIFNPALLISSVISNHADREFKNVFIVFGIAIVMFAIFILAGFFASLVEKERRGKVVIKLMFVFSNLGFIGLPVIRAVLGKEYVIYNAIYNLIYNIVFYTYGVSLMNEGDTKIFSKKTLKQIFSIGTLGAICAITLFFLNLRLPLIVEESIEYFGASCVPLALFIIGVTLGEQKSLIKIFTDKSLYFFFAVKMLVIPVLCSILIKRLPIQDELKFLAVLMVGMPVGSLPLLILAERDWDCSFCSNGIIITTILSVCALPAVVFVYQFL